MNHQFTNHELATLFDKVAAVLTATGGDFFRTRAYQNAAASIEHTASSVLELWQENQLDTIPGVGTSIQEHLEELFTTGKVKEFDALFTKVPQGMFPLLNISGVGPKKAYKLAKVLLLDDDSTALNTLKAAIKAHKIQKIPGFGTESESDLSLGLEKALHAPKKRLLLPLALDLSSRVINYLKKSSDCLEAETLGSLRRRSATIGDIDIAVSTRDPAALTKHLLSWKEIKQVISSGDKTTMFVHQSGLQVDVKTQYPDQWGSLLQHYTGSKLHNIQLRSRAVEAGMSLSENGIKDKGQLYTFKTETDFYQYLKLDYIPPELREGLGEIEASQNHQLPGLVKLTDIKGDLHIHTDIDIATSHDQGVDTVADLLLKAKSLGYQYIGLTDHNPRQSQISAKKRLDYVKRRKQSIEQSIYSLEKKHKNLSKVFTGLEVDIKSDGTLAVNDDILEQLDYAIVSVHSRFNQDIDAATSRILKALSHPKAKILGHPTGRLLNQRDGLSYHLDELFTFCVKHHKLLEINSCPDRLDLPDNLVKPAIDAGVSLIIDTDSHAASHMDLMSYGVTAARRGWASPSNIANTLPYLHFRAILLGVTKNS